MRTPTFWCSGCGHVVSTSTRYNVLGALLALVVLACLALGMGASDEEQVSLVCLAVVLAIVARTKGRTRRCDRCGSRVVHHFSP